MWNIAYSLSLMFIYIHIISYLKPVIQKEQIGFFMTNSITKAVYLLHQC
jgi:penicillin-binding protein-related factor A (putative recombinase)